jgi:fluoroacetyl-CoA thioesterase
MSEPELHATAEARITVRREDLASALLGFAGDDEYPDVFSTSKLVAIMEIAASRLLIPHLKGDELSVGVSVDIRHTAATPVGAVVTATARFMGRDGKLFVFDVVASDNGGEIGRGSHKRAIVSTARLLSGAAKRA